MGAVDMRERLLPDGVTAERYTAVFPAYSR